MAAILREHRRFYNPRLFSRRKRHCVLSFRLFTSSSADIDKSVSIGNVIVPSTPSGSGRPDLVPSCLSSGSSEQQHSLLLKSLPPSSLSHLRWMLQKDLLLQQDFCLLGAPHLARDRRALLLLYAMVTSREVEYLSLSRDTSDADLKQRKEVKSSDNGLTTSSVYMNQAPVRAALHGRLLILDGLEKAERNVLPTLNNLLENRELSLDDGSLLVAPHVYDQHVQDNVHHTIRRVHPDFRVAALGTLSESNTATLDPPLRSRFQARIADELNAGDVLESLNVRLEGKLDLEILKELVQMAASTTHPSNRLSFAALHDASRYLLQHPQIISTESALLLHGTGMMGVDDVVQSSLSSFHAESKTESSSSSSSAFVETPTTGTLRKLLTAGLDHTRSVILVGPKGCGKSALARQVASSVNNDGTRSAELFSLFRDMTSRDLLMSRGTDESGNTVWRKTPLTRAVEGGSLVILDGVDKLNQDTLSSLALLLEEGQVDLPDGTRMQAADGFGAIAIAHPPSDENRWITPEVANMFYWIEMEPLPSDELNSVLAALYPSLGLSELDKMIKLRDRLDDAILSGAADTLDEQESLFLSLRKLKHIGKRLERRGSDLARVIRDALLTSLMPERDKRIVETCMVECGIEDQSSWLFGGLSDSVHLDEETLQACRRTPRHPLLVPNPVFEENPGHAEVLRDILDAHSVGERALLIMGYQGVGKNRVVDFLLNKLQCEREYLQLHRDTTIQSLLSSPSVEGGRLIYGESPLIRAAKHGRILVVDEADKAPVEVVALLKGLIEDGELALPDGRILRYETDDNSSDSVIPIHPDFRVWALANPAGYPFHGNDLAREMADVFSCHTVPPLDAESQTRILKRYGPNVPEPVIGTIISIWQDLAEAHRKGVLGYPFSIREAVSVVRHLQEFPNDGLNDAIENVIAFDRFDNALLKQLGAIFARHGVKVSFSGTGYSSEELASRTEGGISTPRTRAGSPKHGKIDPDNTPHVGGNTWAGGTGGSDTAGLGGRGGPYRLDAGHPVHQVSDEMKAQVTEEAQRRARQMAKEALDEKLKELNMGKLDWERYDSLRDKVAMQIQQLQVHLKDIQRRKEERVWLRRQSHGELDDSRLVDALAGEKDVFKRRGMSVTSPHHASLESQPMKIKFVVDVSASMYRFNGYDGRLERLLEASLMIMETLRDDSRFDLEIVGHNGSNGVIPLLHANDPRDPATQLRILESMVAHTQYTWAGDSTLEAMDAAVNQASDGDLVILISDANLQRYRIDAEDVTEILRQKDEVHTHLIFIGSMGEEAQELAHAIPNERAQVCLDSGELPLLLKSIVASAAK